jgi:TP901 family phage tail tape measure protein
MALGVNIVSKFDAKGIKKAITEFKKLEGAGAKGTFALRTMDNAAKQLAAVAVKAAAGFAVFGGLAVREFVKFDAAMTQSLAIMGDVSDAMKTQMSQAARQMAKETTFSAEEAAKSYFFLASAGLNAEQSLKALPIVAKFGQAGMFDMALATDLLTDAQSALGLTIRDNTVKNMQQMAKVSDVLVRANTLANATVQQFSEALTNKAGAAMKAVNMDIETGVAVLAALADQGIKGAEAGTQFSIALRDLQSKAIENKAGFEAMGVSVFDNNGKLRNMGDIVADLEGLLAGATDETKKITLSQLGFADKSVSTILALLGTSDAIKNYEKELRSAGGFTQDVADKQLQSLQAQLKLAKNAIVDVAIQIGERLAPMVKGVTDFIRELSAVISEEGLGGAIRFSSGELLNFIGNMGALGNTIYGLITAFVALRLVAIAATISQVAFNTALFANPIGIAVAAIIALGVAVVAAYIKFEGFRKVVNTVINAVIGYVEFMANIWIRAINIVIAVLNKLSTPLRAIGINIPEIARIGEVSFGRISTSAAITVRSLGDVADETDRLIQRFAALGNSAVDVDATATKIYTLADAQGAVAQAQKNLDTLRKSEHKDLVALKAATDTLSAAQGNLALITGDKKTGGVSKSVETAREKIKKFTEALRDATSAQKSLQSATKATINAQGDLAEANTNLVLAQKEFNQIVSGYGKDSKQASDKQEKLDEAQRDVERSAYGIEEAIFAVRDAEAALAKARLDPDSNAQTIREAEISLAKAKLAVKDAEDRQRDATVSLNKAQEELNETVDGAKKGSDAYEEILKKVNDAKKAQKDAIDTVVEAQERERDAILKVAEAQRELNDLEREYGKLLLNRAKQKFDAFGQTVLPSATAMPQVTFPSSPNMTLPPDFISDQRILPDTTVNFTVNAGVGTDKDEVARFFLDVMKSYERANGVIPLTVASVYAV